jgi:hypothetical protein
MRLKEIATVIESMRAFSLSHQSFPKCLFSGRPAWYFPDNTRSTKSQRVNDMHFHSLECSFKDGKDCTSLFDNHHHER